MRTKNIILSLAISLLSCMLFVTSVYADTSKVTTSTPQIKYSAISTNEFIATSINNKGQVLGEMCDSGNPCIWDNGKLSLLEPLDGSYHFAATADINDSGTVVGRVYKNNAGYYGFVWENGQQKILDSLGGNYSAAYAINNKGQIVGESSFPSGSSNAILWEDGKIINLGTLGGVYAKALGINDNGQIVGTFTMSSGHSHGFLWENGKMTDLGTLGGYDSGAYSINNKGQIVGYSYLYKNENQVACIWENGQIRNLDNNYLESSATSINNLGQIAGDIGGFVARFWIDGYILGREEFNELHSRASINDKGQIAGTATLEDGSTRAFIAQLISNTPGDVNNDFKVNSSDLSLLKRYALKMPTDLTTQNADIDGDGKLNSKDYSLLKRMILSQASAAS